MATQKNTKSSKVKATKGNSAKSSAGKKPAAKKPVARKPAPKAPVKGKKPVKAAVNSKSKATSKSTGSSNVKKATPVVKKPVAKTAQKPIVKKAAPQKAAPQKTIQVKTKAITGKPVAAPKSVIKPIVKPSPLPVLKPVATKAVNTVSKPNPKAVSPGIKPATIVKPIEAQKTTIAKPATKPAPPQIIKAKPVVIAAKPIVTPVKPEIIASKPILTPVKPEVKTPGSKSSDLAKPSISSKPMVQKSVVQKPVAEKPTEHDQPKERDQPKEFQRKSLKQNTAHTVKSHDTMSDKKENKTMGVAFPDEPQKSRYNDKELEEFDQLIDQKLIVAREQLEFYLKQLEDMAENPDNKIKGLDDGLSTLESERVSSMASRQQKLIQHLENAKIRIKNKVYGICRETGKLISKERLRAVPHATLSIEAKQAQN